MGDFALIFGGLVNGLPFLISHFVTSVIVFLIGVIIYLFITPMKEIALIRKKNTAAAISFSGALIGLALPLASSLSASGSIYEIIVWGLVAIVIQLFCFKAVDILINDLPKRIENGELSSSILLFSIKISVALLNSAAISG
jgi:putative membrane protein